MGAGVMAGATRDAKGLMMVAAPSVQSLGPLLRGRTTRRPAGGVANHGCPAQIRPSPISVTRKIPDENRQAIGRRHVAGSLRPQEQV